MSERKPWFLVMTPDEANRPGSSWLRKGAAARGKLVVLPIAPQGWIALLVFVVALVGAIYGIGVQGHTAGLFSPVLTFLVTLGVIALIVLGFIWLVRATMTRQPPPDSQSL
jgi:hypothetical protein